MLPTSSDGFEVNHSRMREVARLMRQDLAALRSGPLHHLQGGAKAGGTVGKWDVPVDLGAKVDDAHQAMVKALEMFVRAFDGVAGRVEETAVSYDRTQNDVNDITRRAARPTMSNTPEWD